MTWAETGPNSGRGAAFIPYKGLVYLGGIQGAVSTGDLCSPTMTLS